MDVGCKPLRGIEHLVTTLSISHASKPRDIVYSLVSIARDTHDLVSYHTGQEAGKNELTNSSYYKLGEAEVYKGFVMYRIHPSGSLDIICRLLEMPKQGKDKLPSWIRLLRDSEFGEPAEVYNGRKMAVRMEKASWACWLFVL